MDGLAELPRMYLTVLQLGASFLRPAFPPVIFLLALAPSNCRVTNQDVSTGDAWAWYSECPSVSKTRGHRRPTSVMYVHCQWSVPYLTSLGLGPLFSPMVLA